jgi:hypothetical protein
VAKDLLAEDRLVEWATFAFYFAGGVVGFALVAQLARLRAPRWIKLFYAAISVLPRWSSPWKRSRGGRGPSDSTTPAAVERVNIQKEFNLHNLMELDDVVGVRRAGARRGGPDRPPLRRPRSNLADRCSELLISCLLAIVVTTGLDLVTFVFSIQKDFDRILVDLAEVVEMLLAVAGFAYVWLNRRMLLEAYRDPARRGGS